MDTANPRVRPLVFLLCLNVLISCSSDSGPDEVFPGANTGEHSAVANSNRTSSALFTLLDTAHSGLSFVNLIEEDERLNYVVCTNCYSGGGVAIGDVDGDGLPDVFMVSNLHANRLYRNLGGMKFEDITDHSGIGPADGWSNGVAMADVNGDGLLDIYISRGIQFTNDEQRENKLFINVGDAQFREAAAEFGINDAGYSVQATFLDYDLDGDLDMYLINRPNVKLMEEYDMQKRMLIAEDPHVRDQLYRNEGGTHFTNVSAEAGIFNCAYGLSVNAGDYNSDGFPDIFVANDFVEHDFLYINQGDGTFRDEVHSWMQHISNFSMGADVADFNNDGELDIYVVDMVAEDHYRNKVMMGAMSTELFDYSVYHGYHRQYMANMLHLNTGVGDFQEIAQMAGVSKTDWSWAVLLVDFDLDGWKDIFVSNGNWRDSRHNDFVRAAKQTYFLTGKTNDHSEILSLVKETPQSRLRNYVFRNKQDLTFEDVRDEWGLDVSSFSNGAAYGDLDADGDLDLVINNINDPAFVYRNNSVEQGRSHFLHIRLEGPGQNTWGYGARVVARQADLEQTFELTSVRGYLSSVEALAFFGFPTDANVEELIIIWPGGKQQVLRDVEVNQSLTLQYNAAAFDSNDTELIADAEAKTALETHTAAAVDSGSKIEEGALLEEIAAEDLGITTVHKELAFDDFEAEILLPHRMSRHGPGIAVGDVNGDGREDFYHGAGASGIGALYIQAADGSFSKQNVPAFERDAAFEDMGVLFFDADADGDLDLYVVSGSAEFPADDQRLKDRLYRNTGATFVRDFAALPAETAPFNGSCVVAGDLDKDGDLDLFVGGRSVPGVYPQPAPSRLLINEAGIFRDKTAELAPDLLRPGMVTAAVWTDFDNNGTQDLFVTGEWMPIRIFRNHNGRLIDYSSHRDINNSVGWWHSITPVDVDNDGDMDYVLGNQGLNSKYKGSPEKPLHVYLNDFDDNGSKDIILAYYNSGECFPVRGRECSSEQIPEIANRFPSYDEFASASLVEVYGKEDLDSALHYTASEFRSCVMFNHQGKEFSLEPLPNEAQLAPVFGIVVDDVNLDGNADLILNGNMFSQETETIRYDAFRGLLLLGLGDGNFDVQTAQESGLHITGDAKGSALLRSVNGQTLMIVGMNSAAPKIVSYANSDSQILHLADQDLAVLLDFGTFSRRVERPFGSGYISAGTRSIRIPPNVQSVHIVDSQGTLRPFAQDQ